MGPYRVNNNIFLWFYKKSGTTCRTRAYYVKSILHSNDWGMYENVSVAMSAKELTAELTANLMEKYVITDWIVSITNETGRR